MCPTSSVFLSSTLLDFFLLCRLCVRVCVLQCCLLLLTVGNWIIISITPTQHLYTTRMLSQHLTSQHFTLSHSFSLTCFLSRTHACRRNTQSWRVESAKTRACFRWRCASLVPLQQDQTTGGREEGPAPLACLVSSVFQRLLL